MIYTSKGRSVKILRIATPADIVDIGNSDPGVYRASRSPSRVTLVCEDSNNGTLTLENQAQMSRFQQNPMEMAERMNEILGSKEGG